MQVNVKRMKRVDVVEVSGRIDHHTAPELRQTLEGLIDQGRARIVVDMDGVSFCSSVGVRTLMEMRSQAQRTPGGDVRLARLQPNIDEAFQLAGMHKLFRIYPDLVEAVGSFG